MKKLSQLFEQAQRKWGRYAISNLMQYLVIGMGLVYVADFLLAPTLGTSISALLSFNTRLIAKGQIWRLISFVLLPPASSPIFILFSLYFYYLIGTTLANQWGSFRFNVYYLFGIIGSILAGLITGYTSNYYLNFSLFFAFAILYPDYELLLFFILPVKMKWLALLDGVLLIFSALQGGLSGWLTLIFSLANVLLFFGGDLLDLLHSAYRRYKWRQNWK